MGRFLRSLDLGSWDNWFPLAVIAVFLAIGGSVAAGGVSFGITPRDADRFQTIYTSIGVQTTAGIFAITISLSLVAIQFAAQQYSHRIMDYYIKSVMFWSTFIVYLGVMIAGILLLASSSESDSLKVVGIIVVGSLLALTLLIPHFLVTASYLKPEFIIRKLLRRVDREYLRLVNKTTPGSRMDSASDRLLPVVEITERSIDRGDLTTTRGALERISHTYTLQATDGTSPAIDRYFMDHILRIGRKAVAKSDQEEAAVQTIDILGRVGKAGPAKLAVENIDILGFAALKRDAEVVVTQMIDSLRLIFDGGPPEIRESILDTLKELVGRLAAARQERLLRHLADHLEEMAYAAREDGDHSTEIRCFDLIEAVGHDAAVHDMVALVLRIGGLLQGLGMAAVDGDAEDAEGTILRLLRIERAVTGTELEVKAALGFNRGEIERVRDSSRSSGTLSRTRGGADGGGLDVSGLWGKPEQ